MTSDNNELQFDTENIDFGALLDTSLNKKGGRKPMLRLKAGDKVEGTVTRVTATTVLVDINSRDDAVIDVLEFKNEAGEITIHEGDSVSAYCLSTNNGVTLTTKISGKMVDSALADAQVSGLPVEGRVVAERKGGYEVKVGNSTAFCPYSQMDVHRQDAAFYIGNAFLFQVQEYSENGRNIVLNRRKLVEKERAEKEKALQESLSVGDIVEGRVVRIAPFGAFVDIGGVEGLVHLSELSWTRAESAEGLVTVGQVVQVKIKDLNWQNGRISLSLRSTTSNPWNDLQVRYSPGRFFAGKVTRIAPFGAFVELEPGIEGLVHISKLGAGRRVNSPDEVVKVGDTVEVRIESIDNSAMKISLSMDKKPGKGETVETAGQPVSKENLSAHKGDGSFGSLGDVFGKLKL